MIERVIDKKEEIFFIAKPNLFTFGTITLPKSKKFSVAIFNVEIGTKDPTFNFLHFEG
jgi:hypothetical protein